jgi:hypothetical protein
MTVVRAPLGAASTYHIVRVVVQHSKIGLPMSAMGQKQTLEHVRVMSALPPKADMDSAACDVRFVPKADIGVSFNDFIGTGR